MRGSAFWRRGAVTLTLAITGCIPFAALAQDKRPYSLFKPVPDALLREMSTDRPDLTETPFTIDAGRFQFEANFFGYTRARRDANGELAESYDFATTNFRLGLTHNTEINLVWQPYGVVRTHRNGGARHRQAGVGSVDIRGKINVWGNDDFSKLGTAFAILPYVTLPTRRGNGISGEGVEGGVILPFAIKLNDKFGLGLNTGVAAIRDRGGFGYLTEWAVSAALSYEWSERLGTYYEVAGRFIGGDATGEVILFGTGVTHKIHKNLQLDAGVNFGLTPASDRISPFVGISARY